MSDKPTAEDAYEKQYMAGSGSILHRERTVWRLHWVLLFPPIMTLIGAGMGFAGIGQKPMPLAVAFALIPFALLLTLLWAMFIALRTTVTDKEVIVQFGLFGPRIPLDAITRVEVKDYPMLSIGGGIKRYDGAWAYVLAQDTSRAVRIEWKKPGGGAQATILSSSDPDALAAHIQRARGVAAPAVRVEAISSEARAPDIRDEEFEDEAASGASQKTAGR
ncbi:MAG: hypothetical protein U0414_11170 [Polyangiaceae bacterium]